MKIKQVLIAIDQLINTLLFSGYADETISSHAWRVSLKGGRLKTLWGRIVDGLMFFDPNHCKESYESEKNRLQEPPELR